MTGLPDSITAKALAALLGLTDRWVRKLEKQGVLTRLPEGGYEPAANVRAYIAFKTGGSKPDKGEASGGSVSVKELARLLGLTDRWVRSLEKQGVLARAGDGFDPVASIAAFVAWKVKNATEGVAEPNPLQVARAREIGLRIAREDRDVIELDEAIGATDQMAGEYLQSIVGLPARITREPRERTRIEAICDGERDRLTSRFGEIAFALRTGQEAAQAEPEDDA